MTDVFGPPHAECATCTLKETCVDARRFVLSQRGETYAEGGLMVVGEFPAQIDFQLGGPFMGRTGQLLDALLEEAGVDPKSVWKTYALLGRPPRVEAKHLKNHINDLYACLPRLEAEIAAARPRVILALGQLALHAFTGVAQTKNRLLDNPCDNCDPATRKVGPVLQCFNGNCRHQVFAPPGERDAQEEWRVRYLEATRGACPECNTSWKRAKLKMVACVHCGGKKKKSREVTTFHATEVLTGRNGVVGAIFPTSEIPGGLGELGVAYVIPTYSPAMLLSGGGKEKRGKYLTGGQFAARAVLDHMRKAHSLLTRDMKFAVDVISTEHYAPMHTAKVIREYVAAPGEFTVDIETNSRAGQWKTTKIVCIGIHRVGAGDALVVDTRDCGDGWHIGNPIVEALIEFLEDETKRKILHNGPYDRVVMRRIWGVDVLGDVRDTLVAHANCYPDEEHGLGFCAHELTDAPAWKGGHATPAEWDAHAELSGYRTFPELALYNARDTMATGLVWTALNGAGAHGRGRLDVEGVRQVFDVDTQMQQICIDMELAGLPPNLEALAKVEREQTAQKALHLAKMREIVGREDFLPSGGALKWALFDPEGPLRLPILVTTAVTKEPATDADTMRLHIKEPFVREYLAYKAIEYNLSHFVQAEDIRQLGADGRLHPTWNVHGARTGRWTSNPNMQNWPKWMRAIFEAPEGRKFVGADQAQLEMRIIANLSGDANLIHRCATADESDKLNPDCDPHSYVASLVFGASYTTLDRFDPEHKKTAPGEAKCKCQRCKRNQLRDIVKRVVYGLNYGAGSGTILEAIYNGGYDGKPLDVRFIDSVVVTYFKAFPGVPRWRERTLREAIENREVRSPLYGRHRIFPLGDIDASVVYNYPIQSGGADIMARGLMRLRPRMLAIDPTASFIAQIHDAIYVECAEEHAEAIRVAVEESLTFSLAFVPGTPDMPYVASASIGTNLAEF